MSEVKEKQNQQILKPTKRLVDKISAAFGLGFMPVGPGTWGSVPGIPLAWATYGLCQWLAGNRFGDAMTWQASLLCLGILSLLSWGSTICIRETEREWSSHDDKSIVVDEVVGQMVALAWFPPSWWMALAGFVLFRLFDILKPGPIGWVDKNWDTAFGTLLDDLIAGACAGIILLFCWKYLA